MARGAGSGSSGEDANLGDEALGGVIVDSILENLGTGREKFSTRDSLGALSCFGLTVEDPLGDAGGLVGGGTTTSSQPMAVPHWVRSSVEKSRKCRSSA